MSCTKLRVLPPATPEEWKARRDARRALLDAVRARRRTVIARPWRTAKKPKSRP